jgi:hypothetical protein
MLQYTIGNKRVFGLCQVYKIRGGGRLKDKKVKRSDIQIFMESRTMDTVQKHIYSNYHSPSSEPYNVNTCSAVPKPITG